MTTQMCHADDVDMFKHAGVVMTKQEILQHITLSDRVAGSLKCGYVVTSIMLKIAFYITFGVAFFFVLVFGSIAASSNRRRRW